MKSFEQRFYIENPSPAEIFWRNCRLIAALSVAALTWLLKGYVLRRKLRRFEQSERKIQLEDWAQ